MFVPKSIALAFLATTASVGAFTVPKTPLVSTTDSGLKQQQPAQVRTGFDHSLNFWNQDEDVTETSSDSMAQLDSYVDETFGRETDAVPTSTIAFIGTSIFIFAYVMEQLQIYLNKPCLDAGRGASTLCTAEYYDFAEFYKDHALLSYGLILTHVIPFGLLPWVSKQIAEMGPIIKKDYPDFNPFIMQLSMACMGFGLSLEYGWHVADSWYYENNFHVLNFGFYFFLISGFALWADGFYAIEIFDAIFGIILAASTALYPWGNAAQVGAEYPAFLSDFFADGASKAKIPLYAGMSATFLEITRRGLKIFGGKMLAVPLFCIGVNLGFIFLLDGVQYGNAEVVDGVKQLTSQNYIYHIAHDVLGTELGVLVFGLLVKNYVPLSERPAEE